MAVLPAVFRIAGTTLRSPEEGREAAIALVEAIRDADISFTDAAGWDVAGRCVEAAFGDSPEEALEKSQAATDPDAIKIARLVLRTVVTDLNFHEIAQAHLWAATGLAGVAGEHEDACQSFSRFLIDFWSAQLAHSRYAFSGPSLVEAALDAARTKTPKEATRHVLDSIVTSLGFQRSSLPAKVSNLLGSSS